MRFSTFSPRMFDVTGMDIQHHGLTLIFRDNTGYSQILTHALPTNAPKPVAGDIVNATGKLVLGDRYKIPTAVCTELSILRHEPPPQATAISGPEFVSGHYDYQPVTLQGQAVDVIYDEIAPSVVFLILDCAGERIPCPTKHLLDKTNVVDLVGIQVRATGICLPTPGLSRLTVGRILSLTSRPIPQSTQPLDLFSAPNLSEYRFMQPKTIANLGHRKLSGRVLAVWNHDALIQTSESLVARIDFRERPLPQLGQCIEAVGLPETDVYMPILRRATWRPSKATTAAAPVTSTNIPFTSIFLDDKGDRRIDSLAQGKLIRTVAKIRSLPSNTGPINYMYVGTDDFALPVDISSANPRPEGLAVGSTVEITGIYLIENQPWRPNVPIPPIDSVRIIVRSADDIRILSTPSWWTAGRLLIVVGVLFAVLALVLVWNLALRRLAERRGRTLSEERIARAEAEIKTMERTRLAVELHDTIAQNLTGVSIALDTARQFCQTANPDLLRQIDVAGATLDSCQTELRNCLWDLRNQALDETDLNTAIRTALLPHVNDTVLDIRFNVDRNRLTENTTHAILRIIRELVINAIRHGHATHIQIAGALDPDALRFSVRDNGCGFDIARSPGIAQKHFGLQGIRERLSLLNGKLSIESANGSGTRVAIAIPLPDYQEQPHTP